MSGDNDDALSRAYAKHPFFFRMVFVAMLVFTLLLDTVASISIWNTTNDAHLLTEQLKTLSVSQGHELGRGVGDIINLSHVTTENNRILRELCRQTPGCVVVRIQPRTTTTTHPPQGSP